MIHSLHLGLIGAGLLIAGHLSGAPVRHVEHDAAVYELLLASLDVDAGMTHDDKELPRLDSDLVEEHIRKRTGAAGQKLASHRSGMFLSTTAVRESGRLIRLSPDRKVSNSCGGILIGPRQFLTAGHCVCETGNLSKPFYATAAECRQNGAPEAADTKVFLPQYGIFGATGEIWLHPEYRQSAVAAGLEGDDPGDKVHDFAIVTLDTERYLPFVKLWRPDASSQVSHFAWVSFGPLTTDNAANFGVPANATFHPGLSQVSGLGPQAGCAALKGHARLISDVICFGYSPGIAALKEIPGLPSPLPLNTAACPGDSGGALLAVTQGGQYYLFGLVSFITPAVFGGGPASCRREDRVTAFAMIRDSFAEISAEINHDVARGFIEGQLTCDEGLIYVPERLSFAVQMHPGAYANLQFSLQDITDPDISIEGWVGSVECEAEVVPGILVCSNLQAEQMELQAYVKGTGLLQFTRCSPSSMERSER